MNKLSIKKSRLILFLIIAGALWFRVIGINWDQNQHLHPDERFLTMVTQKLEFPQDLKSYLDPNASTMNPYNKETGFYVYGTLPLTIVKLVSLTTDNHNYDGIAIVGRLVSAIFDIGTLFLVYKMLLLFKKPQKIALLATFLYAIMVLPIQLSHFFVVDTFLVFFTTTAVYFAAKFHLEGKRRNIAVSAICFGGAVACKISAIYIAPLVGIFLMLPRDNERQLLGTYFIKLVSTLLTFGVLSYVIVRFADPHLFQYGNFLDPTPAERFIANMKELAVLASNKSGYFPPSVQWYKATPLVFALKNIMFFGVGIPIFLSFLTGILILFKKNNKELKIIGSWVLLFFLYQSTRFSPSMRYFFILYPFMAIICAVGVSKILSWINIPKKSKILVLIVGIVLFIIWPVGFAQIYTVPHSRVTASYWIYNNIPSSAVLTMEHWDDGLPLRLPGAINNQYETVSLPVFAEDTTQKWDEMRIALDKADYIIMSSNRGYGSVMGQRDKYPIMTRWYENLFSERLGYRHVKSFTSYPTWCIPFTKNCVEFDDQWSEEAFTVYDHPKVTIYEKLK